MLSEGGALKHTLKDKSLEEIGRLGGLGILTLPPEFAVDKLVLPTCLSATATYLCQHGKTLRINHPVIGSKLKTGCNAPGIFRVSGQVTTISALYDYYDQQFAQAGSPSRVEETVGCGQLPAHIEYTVPDVASVFKKILIGLPGGLLGSLELFEAFRDILHHLNFNPDMPNPERTALRARLIALAIVSVSSTYRVYLIQAVLGLVAYFAFEAERLQAGVSIMDGPEQPSQANSELMGYHSFGVVLGPLLLGDLTNNIDISGRESQEDTRDPRTDTAKKVKKQKRNTTLNKLEKDANLTAQVDRANLTAGIMQLLLLNWKDVVKQLQNIHGISSSQSRSTSRPKHDLNNAGSRLSLKVSNEDMLFIDVLRGRTVPDDFKGIPVQMKGRVRISSRSPMSRGALNISKDEHRRPAVAELPTGNEERIKGNSPTNHNDRVVENVRKPDRLGRSSQSTVDVSHSEEEERSPSDLELARMAMGTILPHPKDSPFARRPGSSPRYPTPTDTPRQARRQRSSSDTPATTVKVVQSPIYNTLPASRLQWALDKPLPPIGDLQRAEISPPKPKENAAESLRTASHGTSLPEWVEGSSSPTRSISPNAHLPPRLAEDKGSFPPRQSSMVREARLPMRPIRTYESLAEYKALSDACMAPPLSAPHSRKISDAQSRDEELPPAGEKRNSVRMLAQQFAEASRAGFKSDEAGKDNTLPKVYAYIRPLSPEHGHSLPDPFTTRPGHSPSPERESLIPKPVRNIGRSRKAESRSPSPPKAVSPTRSVDKRPSVYNIIPDRDAEIVKNNTASSSPPQRLINAEDVDSEGSDSRFSRIFDGLMKTIPERGNQATPCDIETASTRPHSYPAGPQNVPSPIQEEQQRVTSLAARAADLARSGLAKGPKSPNLLHGSTKKNATRTNSYLDASNALKPLERHGSMNATLYSEIIRLQRQLELKGEEVQSAKRESDAVRDAYKEGDIADQNGHGRWSQGRLDEEIKQARKEILIWKRRAQAAEERLKATGGLAGVVAEVMDQKGEGSDGDPAITKRRDSGNGMEVLEKKGAAKGMNVEVKVWRKEDEGRKGSEHTGRVMIQESDDDDETF